MSDRPSEERVLDIALVFAGMLPLVVSLAKGGSVGIGLAICLLMSIVGGFGLVRDVWHARKPAVPPARIPRPRPARTIGRQTR